MPPIRTYPENSAQAMGRVVAMVMIADGELAESELATLSDPEHLASLGLDALAFRTVLADHLVDVALASPSSREVRVNHPDILSQVLAPVTDPALRLKTAALALAACGADDAIHPAEHAVLSVLLETWQLTLPDVSHFLATHTG